MNDKKRTQLAGLGMVAGLGLFALLRLAFNIDTGFFFSFVGLGGLIALIIYDIRKQKNNV